MITPQQIERWLQEDVGHHDVTNQVPGETTGRLVATESGVLAGVDAAASVFEYLGVNVTDRVDTGAAIDAGAQLLTVEGAAQDVLRAERVAVNLVGHASGIATLTSRAVDAASEAVRERDGFDDRVIDAPPKIAATRKTTPGLRGLEKRAVVAGGGDTHRLDLSHTVMVKDNHVAEMGLESAIEHFSDLASFTTKIEVEVETSADAPRAAASGADILLLDNMDPEAVRTTVDRLSDEGFPDVLTEASGGISLESVPAYAVTGVDVISMGALTHSAPSLDLSFRTDG